uniref:C2 domain-containing protein n=1 Tax=Chlamydomonas leiostraca TaxID=1034604 RepID=A0A7S0S0C1_9CHLO|mmetsp:Transcript_37416/g.94418  ORF Transcript_37416/g.94418 Transcript_37416/m.94418 type:complete len:671 (+) Transcript_37416:81-2093(+)|eukprot:CAMPEP_0202860614 /NCGR_PEP_ID=MMETSP1391-20130828/2262_1 /ASSEMBLY_ACC=CAM_ASM_000867 /TAXON_ID=1034604 /ORGANISM="Chlamydomonas leiostraca, Strain SAG 11-49" /LENGTH=670 /DNA_ID=CAMNT_0049539823 /DNA_START=25 /DNA_END=2037 /DNA_ORIENTATION=+
MVFFAAGFGLGLGAVAGLSVGPYVFAPLTKPKSFKPVLDEEADNNDEVLPPEHGTPVTAEMRSLLEFTEPWTFWPDYERVTMINRILAVMWPHVTKAVLREVLKQVGPILEKQVFSKFAFIEDIVLGTQSLKKPEEAWAAWVKDKDFDIGKIPPRMGGVKSYNTSDDEVVIETPLVWGSDCQFDVGVFLRFGPIRLYVPVQVANLHFKIEPRITIKPLVEEMPCVGGATLTLLKAPHVDMSLKIIKGVDLMALPGIKDGLRFAIQHVLGGMLIYPNGMSFPIMPNFGISPPAQGALNIKLLRGENIPGDETYVRFEIRKGRPMQSTTVSRVKNAGHEWGQEFNMIIDDLQTQQLQMAVFEDDFGWNDTKIGVGELAFGEMHTDMDHETGEFKEEFTMAEFVKDPMKEKMVAVKLHKPISKAMLKQSMSMARGAAGAGLAAGVGAAGKASSFLTRGKVGSSAGKGAAPAPPKEKDYGTLYLKVMFLPFFQPSFDDEDEEEVAAAKAKKANTAPRPPQRAVTHKVSDKMKGVLTVHLIRCINLMGEDPTTRVKMYVTDEEHDQVQYSKMVFSENSPRWGDKFDFVMVTAGSVLHLTVLDKESLTSSVLSKVNIFKKSDGTSQEDKGKVLGKLQIPVKDVARNGSLKDIWTLADTERGQIELALTWQTCYIAE